MEKTREPRQHSASLEHDYVRQSRLAMKADVKLDKKTCKRTEGAAAAERVMIRDKSSAQVDTDPIRLTIFDNDNARPPAFVVQWMTPWLDHGTALTKSCLSHAEMRTGTAAGGLLSADTASTARRAIFSRPLPSWILGEEANERTSRTNNN